MSPVDQYTGVGTNRTYQPNEPQQIHLSLVNEGQSVKIQFATLQPIETTHLKYWSKDNPDNPIQITTSQDWAFVDGGTAQRTIYLHNIQTKILEQNKVYQYQVGSSSHVIDTLWSSKFEFHTPSPRTSFSFLAIGDLGVENAVTMSELTKRASTHRYDFLTLAGDQAYDFSDFDGQKGDEYMNFVQPLIGTVPYLGAVGNHEAAYNYSHYINRFNIVPFQESKSISPLFYSFNYKSLHLISFSTEFFSSLNQNITETDQSKYALNWLEADLTLANQERRSRPWIIFMTHHPLYCSATNLDCQSPSVIMRQQLEPILLKHKVDLYMAGHVHCYERTYPIAQGTLTSTIYDNATAPTHVLIGNAGQPEGPSVFPLGDTHSDWSARRYSGYGFSEFTISPHKLEMSHLAVNPNGSLGNLVDHFVISKSSSSSSEYVK
ncbi:Metallo-dependent phosphatase-like protein [Chlamydoabsidia padenii]|nr:Metallo-dependent phosphatase-like protein [Chlamydoabsidia padenii]